MFVVRIFKLSSQSTFHFKYILLRINIHQLTSVINIDPPLAVFEDADVGELTCERTVFCITNYLKSFRCGFWNSYSAISEFSLSGGVILLLVLNIQIILNS